MSAPAAPGLARDGAQGVGRATGGRQSGLHTEEPRHIHSMPVPVWMGQGQQQIAGVVALQRQVVGLAVARPGPAGEGTVSSAGGRAGVPVGLGLAGPPAGTRRTAAPTTGARACLKQGDAAGSPLPTGPHRRGDFALAREIASRLLASLRCGRCRCCVFTTHRVSRSGRAARFHRAVRMPISSTTWRDCSALSSQPRVAVALPHHCSRCRGWPATGPSGSRAAPHSSLGVVLPAEPSPPCQHGDGPLRGRQRQASLLVGTRIAPGCRPNEFHRWRS